MQFVNIAISEEVSLNILETYMKSVKSLNKRERHKCQKTCVSQVIPLNSNFVENINTFNKKILDGSYFICTVCNRCLYKRSVIDYKEEKYNIFVEGLYTDVKSFDGKLYVCKTCDLKLKKGKVPCQAVYNKLAVSCLPEQFKSVRKLDRVLISKAFVQESDNHAKGSVATT